MRESWIDRLVRLVFGVERCEECGEWQPRRMHGAAHLVTCQIGRPSYPTDLEE